MLGSGEPSAFVLNLPLYICIFLWLILAVAVANLVWLNHKRWSKITLTAILGVFTVASAVVDTNGSGHGALAGFLAANRVDVLIFHLIG